MLGGWLVRVPKKDSGLQVGTQMNWDQWSTDPAFCI